MSAPPFVSVVIPVFDRLEALRVVLGFFNHQDHPRHRFEVIVVDDGSPERADRLLDPRDYGYTLEVLRQENQGRSAARNKGARHARGDLLLFCDADRIPDPAWMTAHATLHGELPGCAAFGVPWDCFYAFAKLEAAGKEHLEVMRKLSRKPEYYKLMTDRLFHGRTTDSPLAWATFLVGNSSIRRADFLEVGGFDEDVRTWGLEHFELGLRLVEHGVSICHLDTASNYHIPHARQVDSLREGIQRGMEVIARKHPGRRVSLLRDFLFGELSLQALEAGYGGAASPALASEAPVYFKGLARTVAR